MRFLKRKLYFLRLFCLNSYIFVLRLFFLFVSTALIWNCIGVNSKQNYAKLLLSFPKCQKELDIALFFLRGLNVLEERKSGKVLKEELSSKAAVKSCFLMTLMFESINITSGEIWQLRIHFSQTFYILVYVYEYKNSQYNCSQKYSFRCNYIK